jgi:hypothetical protein
LNREVAMTSPATRRPLPALVFLLALTVLTSLVWWRVMNRNDHTAAQSTCKPSTVIAVVPRPQSVALSVLNSTSTAGIAKSTAAKLTARGFKVTGYDNDVGHAPIAGVAEIRYTLDQVRAATLLSYYFPGARLVHITSTSEGILTVSLGKRFHAIATDQAVRAGLAKNNVHFVDTVPRTAPSPTC